MFSLGPCKVILICIFKVFTYYRVLMRNCRNNLNLYLIFKSETEKGFVSVFFILLVFSNLKSCVKPLFLYFKRYYIQNDTFSTLFCSKYISCVHFLFSKRKDKQGNNVKCYCIIAIDFL